jgi:hypothetical protein
MLSRQFMVNPKPGPHDIIHYLSDHRLRAITIAVRTYRYITVLLDCIGFSSLPYLAHAVPSKQRFSYRASKINDQSHRCKK